MKLHWSLRIFYNKVVLPLPGAYQLQGLKRRNSLGRPKLHQPLDNREEGLEHFFLDLVSEFVFQPSVNTKIAFY
jgi:hypothetical protein